MGEMFDFEGYEMDGEDTIKGDSLIKYSPDDDGLTGMYPVGVKTKPGCCWVIWNSKEEVSRQGIIYHSPNDYWENAQESSE